MEIVIVNVGILIANILVLGISVKVYTEILKEKSQRNRKGGP